MPKKAILESYMTHATVVFAWSTYSSYPASSVVLPRYVESNGATALSALPTRYLAPSSIKMLWMQFREERSTKVSYLANEHQVDQVVHRREFDLWIIIYGCLDPSRPRYIHFWRQYRNRWSKILRFTTPSNHAACDDRLEFKELFKMAKVSCCQSSSSTQDVLDLMISSLPPLNCTDYPNTCLPMRTHKWLSTWLGSTNFMLTVLNEIENWKSGWRLDFFNHSPKMSKAFYGITPTVCAIMPTAQNMPMEPC